VSEPISPNEAGADCILSQVAWQRARLRTAHGERRIRSVCFVSTASIIQNFDRRYCAVIQEFWKRKWPKRWEPRKESERKGASAIRAAIKPAAW
jgi:hypothetical protein